MCVCVCVCVCIAADGVNPNHIYFTELIILTVASVTFFLSLSLSLFH